MKVVQWNLHHGGKRTDGVLDVAGITQHLIDFVPDLVSLNELEQNDGYGNTDQLETHRAALQAAQGVSWYGVFCTMLGGSKNQGIGVGLLAKNPFVGVRQLGLYGGRPLLCAQNVGKMLYTTHPDPISQLKRNVEIATSLVHQIPPFVGPTLYMGDFNAQPGSVEIAPIGQYYRDAWVEAKKLGRATSPFGDGNTHGSHRIDYIWYFGMAIESCEVPNLSVNGVFPSDHHPVIATFK